jgi:hypothetical protein
MFRECLMGSRPDRKGYFGCGDGNFDDEVGRVEQVGVDLGLRPHFDVLQLSHGRHLHFAGALPVLEEVDDGLQRRPLQDHKAGAWEHSSHSGNIQGIQGTVKAFREQSTHSGNIQGIQGTVNAFREHSTHSRNIQGIQGTFKAFREHSRHSGNIQGIEGTFKAFREHSALFSRHLAPFGEHSTSFGEHLARFGDPFGEHLAPESSLKAHFAPS